MKKSYDFAKGQQGKFYRPGAVRHFPIYLAPNMRTELTVSTKREEITLEQMINHCLRQDLARLETKPS